MIARATLVVATATLLLTVRAQVDGGLVLEFAFALAFFFLALWIYAPKSRRLNRLRPAIRRANALARLSIRGYALAKERFDIQGLTDWTQRVESWEGEVRDWIGAHLDEAATQEFIRAARGPSGNEPQAVNEAHNLLLARLYRELDVLHGLAVAERRL